MIPLLFAIVTATFQPSSPTVGDRITVTFEQPVRLDPSPDYEVVSSDGNRIVVRTFQAKSFALSGTIGATHFRSLIVPVRSVLKANDDLKPAPLVPPRAVPYPREPWIAIGVAALLAALAWVAVWLRSRQRVANVIPALPPEVQFRSTLASLRPNEWARLADATRAFLAATRPNCSTDLTTSELLRRCDDPVVADVLRQGDLEKFSPWGAAPMDFDSIVQRARELAPEEKLEEAA